MHYSVNGYCVIARVIPSTNSLVQGLPNHIRVLSFVEFMSALFIASPDIVLACNPCIVYVITQAMANPV